jgi:hypothetical protein
MYDQWLELDSWTEWMGAVIFTVAPTLLSEIETRTSLKIGSKRRCTMLSAVRPLCWLLSSVVKELQLRSPEIVSTARSLHMRT